MLIIFQLSHILFGAVKDFIKLGWLFDLYNHFYIEIFENYMKEVYIQKFKAWVKEFRNVL